MENAFPAVFGALLALLVSFFVQSYFALRAQRIAYLDDYLKDLSWLEELCIDYWTKSWGDENVENLRILEIKVRGAAHAVALFGRESPGLIGEDGKAYLTLSGKLFDAATGGGFEVVGRPSEPERVIQVMEISNEIRALIRKSRRKIYWAH